MSKKEIIKEFQNELQNKISELVDNSVDKKPINDSEYGKFLDEEKTENSKTEQNRAKKKQEKSQGTSLDDLGVLDSLDTSDLPPDREDEKESNDSDSRNQSDSNGRNDNKNSSDNGVEKSKDTSENVEKKEGIFNNGKEKQRVKPQDIQKLREELENKNDKKSKDFLRVLNKHTEELNNLIDNNGDKKDISRNMGITKALYNGYVGGQIDPDKIIETGNPEDKKDSNKAESNKIDKVNKEVQKVLDGLEVAMSKTDDEEKKRKIQELINDIKNRDPITINPNDFKKVGISPRDLLKMAKEKSNKTNLEDNKNMKTPEKQTVDKGKEESFGLKQKPEKTQDEINEEKERMARHADILTGEKNAEFNKKKIEGDYNKKEEETNDNSDKQRNQIEDDITFIEKKLKEAIKYNEPDHVTGPIEVELNRLKNMIDNKKETDSDTTEQTEKTDSKNSPETDSEGENNNAEDIATPEESEGTETKEDEMEGADTDNTKDNIEARRKILESTPEAIKRVGDSMEEGYDNTDREREADLSDNQKNLKKAFEEMLGLELSDAEVEMLDNAIKNDKAKEEMSEAFDEYQGDKNTLTEPVRDDISMARIKREQIKQNEKLVEDTRNIWTGAGIFTRPLAYVKRKVPVLQWFISKNIVKQQEAIESLKSSSNRRSESPKKYGKRRGEEINKKIFDHTEKINQVVQNAKNSIDNRNDLSEEEREKKKAILDQFSTEESEILKEKYKDELYATQLIDRKSSWMDFGRVRVLPRKLTESGRFWEIEQAEELLGARKKGESRKDHLARLAKIQTKEADIAISLSDFNDAVSRVTLDDKIDSFEEKKQQILENIKDNNEATIAVRRILGKKKIDTYERSVEFSQHISALQKMNKEGSETSKEIYKKIAGTDLLKYVIEKKNEAMQENPDFLKDPSDIKNKNKKEKILDSVGKKMEWVLTPQGLATLGAAAMLYLAISNNTNEKGSSDAGREYMDSRPGTTIEQVQQYQPGLIQGIESIPIFEGETEIGTDNEALSDYKKIINGYSEGLNIREAKLARAIQIAKAKGINIPDGAEVEYFGARDLPVPTGIDINGIEYDFTESDLSERENAILDYYIDTIKKESGLDDQNENPNPDKNTDNTPDSINNDNELRDFYYDLLNSEDYESILRQNPDKVEQAKKMRAIEIAKGMGIELTDDEIKNAKVIGLYYTAVPMGLSTPDRNIEFNSSDLPEIDRLQYNEDYGKAIKSGQKKLKELGY